MTGSCGAERSPATPHRGSSMSVSPEVFLPSHRSGAGVHWRGGRRRAAPIPTLGRSSSAPHVVLPRHERGGRGHLRQLNNAVSYRSLRRFRGLALETHLRPVLLRSTVAGLSGTREPESRLRRSRSL